MHFRLQIIIIITILSSAIEWTSVVTSSQINTFSNQTNCYCWPKIPGWIFFSTWVLLWDNIVLHWIQNTIDYTVKHFPTNLDLWDSFVKQRSLSWEVPASKELCLKIQGGWFLKIVLCSPCVPTHMYLHTHTHQNIKSFRDLLEKYLG